MAVVSKEVIMNRLNEFAGEESTDEVIALLEDVADTLDSLSDNTSLVERVSELESKINETENYWRNKYRERFYRGSEEEEVTEPAEGIESEENIESITYDDLFEEKEDD